MVCIWIVEDDYSGIVMLRKAGIDSCCWFVVCGLVGWLAGLLVCW